MICNGSTELSLMIFFIQLLNFGDTILLEILFFPKHTHFFLHQSVLFHQFFHAEADWLGGSNVRGFLTGVFIPLLFDKQSLLVSMIRVGRHGVDSFPFVIE